MANIHAEDVMEEIVAEEPMRNHNHDLIQVLSEKLDGVVRYQIYHEDAEGECPTCTKMWDQIKEDDQRHVEMLRQEIIKHCKDGHFD